MSKNETELGHDRMAQHHRHAECRAEPAMKPIRWTRHAEGSLRDREIDRAEAERAIREPDRTTPGRGKREIRIRKFYDQVLRYPMLLCVIVEDLPSEYVVVTLYKTSRFDKYLK